MDRRTCLAAFVGVTATLAGCSGDDERVSPGDPADEAARDRSSADLDDGPSDDDAERDDETGPDADETDADESASSATDREIGDRFEYDDLHLVVADVERGTDVLPDEAADRLEDDDLAVVDLAVKHVPGAGRDANGDVVLAVDEQLSVALSDDDDTVYDRVSIPGTTFDPVESRLASGELARGSLVYELEGEPSESEGGPNGLVLEIEPLAAGETTVVDLETTTDSPTSLEQGLAEDALGFADGIEVADVSLTVATLEQGNNLGGFMQSEEGHEIVAVGLVLENESARDRTLSAAQATLTDEFGHRHEVAPGVLGALEGVDDTVVAHGEDHEGTIAYQIADGLEELYWLFDGEPWGDDRRVCWRLR